MKNNPIVLILILFLSGCVSLYGQTVRFAGREWKIRQTSEGKPPGSNNWSEKNVWVDSLDRLHLKISYSKEENKWSCAEIISIDTLSFGLYQWMVVGRIDSLNKNIVLGLFQYGGLDGQNEIDIEMASFIEQSEEQGNFSVYPSKNGIDYTSHRFHIKLSGTYTTHRYRWNSNSVIFQSLAGHRDDELNEIKKWEFIPSLLFPGNNQSDYIPQLPMPVYMNLWLRSGKPPSDGKEAEVIIKSFKYSTEK
ncbi:MAG: hypothetical protein CVV24_13265 [Ignavibacteriae bacterium HGW-Ignavibacteriae-3]|nr:MAG: hypothetical protein CVV24_13265 [Ignavibacteriae bacterium HGW-Ignavibacteriae-3]